MNYLPGKWREYTTNRCSIYLLNTLPVNCVYGMSLSSARWNSNSNNSNSNSNSCSKLYSRYMIQYEHNLGTSQGSSRFLDGHKIQDLFQTFFKTYNNLFFVNLRLSNRWSMETFLKCRNKDSHGALQTIISVELNKISSKTLVLLFSRLFLPFSPT